MRISDEPPGKVPKAQFAGSADIEAIVERRQPVIAAEIPGVSVGVGAIQRDGGLHRIVEIRARIARELVAASSAALSSCVADKRVRGELRAQLVVTRFGADVHVVEQAIHQRAVGREFARNDSRGAACRPALRCG